MLEPIMVTFYTAVNGVLSFMDTAGMGSIVDGFDNYVNLLGDNPLMTDGRFNIDYIRQIF